MANVKATANFAILIIVLIVIRLGFSFQTLYSYSKTVFNSNGNDGNSWNNMAVSYFANSLFGAILSIISIYFLFRFYQCANNAYRENSIEDWEGLFVHFRNYLGISIVIIINWILFFFINIILSRLW